MKPIAMQDIPVTESPTSEEPKKSRQMEPDIPEPRLILASESPRRRQLLAQIGLSFQVIPSRADESVPEGLPPSDVVETLALKKAEEVASREADSLIIAADTIVVLDSRILGKPADGPDAVQMLSRLSGRTHEVFTGAALLQTDSENSITGRKTFSERTKVTFATLTQDEIEGYVRSGIPMDKAGAYGIQDPFGSLFVKRIEGDFYNVVGLPLASLYRELKVMAPQVRFFQTSSSMKAEADRSGNENMSEETDPFSEPDRRTETSHITQAPSGPVRRTSAGK